MRTLLRERFIYIALALVFLLFAAFLRDDGFLTGGNLTNILIQSAPITIMSAFTAFVLSAREIDLSIGAVIGLSTLIAAMQLQNGHSWLFAALASLAAGVVIGAVNGVFVTWIGLPSFLTTLALTGVITGIARWLTDLRTLSVADDSFIGIFGGGHVLNIPALIVWTNVVLLAGYLALHHTRLGAWVLAVGDNPSAAHSQGIPVARMRIIVLALSGMGAALVGLLYAGRLESAAYNMGATDTLTVIAATVIGGTSLFGGKGSIPGVLAGSLLLATLTNGLLLAGFSVTQQIIVQGLVLLLALSVSTKTRTVN